MEQEIRIEKTSLYIDMFLFVDVRKIHFRNVFDSIQYLLKKTESNF